MTRRNADTWICIICGDTCVDNVICYECSTQEKDKQKDNPGTITERQLWFILNRTRDLITIQEAVQAINPDCVWNLECLSMNEAKELIGKLLSDEPVGQE